MKQKYLKRIADKVLDTALEASGAVLIEGPKWCGKTRTALFSRGIRLSTGRRSVYCSNRMLAGLTG
jgi:hypothetical protein